MIPSNVWLHGSTLQLPPAGVCLLPSAPPLPYVSHSAGVGGGPHNLSSAVWAGQRNSDTFTVMGPCEWQVAVWAVGASPVCLCLFPLPDTAALRGVDIREKFNKSESGSTDVPLMPDDSHALEPSNLIFSRLTYSDTSSASVSVVCLRLRLNCEEFPSVASTCFEYKSLANNMCCWIPDFVNADLTCQRNYAKSCDEP